MALTTIKTAALADDAVTEDKIANAINTARAANTAKTTNATHTGDVTGSGSLTIANNAVTLAKMAGGTDGQIITYDASGDPVAVGPGTDGQVLTSTGAGSPPAFEAIPASGKAHNLVINGAMNVAQRSAGPNQTNGLGTVDRFPVSSSGTDETPTQAQVDVAAGTTPYTLGFRKALKITNGNQTSGAGSSDYIRIASILEGQDIANSGWNYVSSSSYITLSFWVKSSVAQNFYGFIRATDGTMQQYPFETGSLSADTWTKVTKTIPGNANLTFDNNNGGAWELWIHQFAGTDETASSVTLNAWAAYSGSAKMPDNTSTWYTTNDATFELTGIQLEVGDSASDFAHESYAETLAKCQRYLYVAIPTGTRGGFTEGATMYTDQQIHGSVNFPVEMRTTPSLAYSNVSQYFIAYSANNNALFDTITLESTVSSPSVGAAYADVGSTSGDWTGNGAMWRDHNDNAYIYFEAELW